MNSVIITGRLTRDVQTNTAQSGTVIARFALAVDRRGREGADFINVVAFGKTAEVVSKHCAKGDKVGIEGRIQTGSYEKDGRKVYTFDVVAGSVEFLGKKRAEEFVETDEPLPWEE